MSFFLKNRLLNLLFPTKCIFCGSIVTNGEIPHCGCQLPQLTSKNCTLCNKPMEQCSCHFAFQQIIAPFPYDGAIQKKLLQLKHTPDPHIVSFFAAKMVDAFVQYDSFSLDEIVPVPTSNKTLRKKGFNQAELLAKQCGKLLSLPVCSHYLERADNSSVQHHLTRKERFSNALASYKYNSNKQLLAGKNILLIDDICTTGATLHACGAALKQAGASNVYALTASSTILS